MQHRKQYDHERVGCAEAVESGSSLRSMSFLLLARESGQGKRGAYVEEKGFVAIAGRIGRGLH